MSGSKVNRITQCLATLKESQKKALVTYIVNGDPEPSITLDAMHKMVDAGADIIELGVPFSDPMAEGPVIQRGHERALASNTSLSDSLNILKQFRQTNTTTPVVLMGYANPVERMGYEAFVAKASECGMDGMITVDLPPEESSALDALLKNANIEPIYLVAPTSTPERIKDITSKAGGFIYYVSLKGVTGAGHLDVGSVETQIAEIKKQTDLPILVGFGIKDATSASAVASLAQGVVVGSALVDIMGSDYGKGKILNGLAEKISDIRAGLD